MRLQLKIWRQAGPTVAGQLVDYVAEGVSTDMSFLEMLDVVNEGSRKRATMRSPSTRIAAKASAACAASW